jgi:transposase
MPRAASEHIRWEAVHRLSQGESQRSVARRLRISPSSIKRWSKLRASGGIIKARTPPGRPRSVNDAAARKAFELLEQEQNTTTEAARALYAQGLTPRVVHRTTLSRHAKRQAKAEGKSLMVVSGKPEKALTPNTISRRLAFCQKNKNRDWRRVLFTDRKRFVFAFPGTKVKRTQWKVRGSRGKAAFKPNKPQTLNVYGGVCAYGTTKLHIVAGTSRRASTYTNGKGQASRNITLKEYRDVMDKTLLPEGKRLFAAQGISSWVFQQDNDPSHKKPSKEAIDAFPGHVKLLQHWPPSSPDLSPIENLWSIVDAKVQARGCNTFDEFVAAVQQEWAAVSKELCEELIGSMKRRVVECIEAEGGKTGY